MRLRRMGHKPLRAAGFLAGKSHSDSSSIVRDFIYLATDLVSRAAVSISARVAILDNEICYYPVYCDAAEVSAFGLTDEVINVQRGFYGEKLNSKRTFAGSHYGVDRFTDSR